MVNELIFDKELREEGKDKLYKREYDEIEK